MLSIRVLGSFSLIYGDTEIDSIHALRLQALLVYLLLHRQAPQSRHHLAFLFWPDTTEAQAHTNLRQLLHTLRLRLPECDRFVEITDKTVRWRIDAPCILDLAEFETALLAASQAGGSERMGALERAVAVYGGDLLPGCYDEWLLVEREKLAQRYLDALEQLVLLLEQRRDYRRAIDYAERSLQSDPLREATYRRLMRLHALNGERAAALRVYHVCATTLERELGVPPGAATHETYERLFDLEGHPAPVTTPAGTALLVGRQDEWQVLQDGWRAVQRGGVRCIFLAGEPGIGKTRLAEEMLHWARQQGITTATTCAYAGGGSLIYAPLVELLRAEGLRPGIRTMAAVWRSELARLLPDLLAEDPKLPPPAPLTERWHLQRLYDAVGKVLLRPDRPLLVLLDDLQWFDAETIAWLHYLLHPAGLTNVDARQLPRLMVLATLRPEEIDDEHPVTKLLVDLRRSDRLTELALAPLSTVETTDLADRLADRRLDATTAAAIYRTSEGNPLFIVETMRAHAVDVTGSNLAPPLQMTPVVQAVIRARLAQLSPAGRELAGLAAAMGRSFAYDALALASDQDENTLVRSLDELWRRRIVRERGANAYDFSHDRLREAAYNELSPARRRLVHRRLAGALETLHAQDTTPVSAQLALHYVSANLPAHAVPHYRDAAEAALRLHAAREGIGYLASGVALIETLAATRERDQLELRMQLDLGLALFMTEESAIPEIRQAYERAEMLATQLGDDYSRYLALDGLHDFCNRRSDRAKGGEIIEQLLLLARKLEDPLAYGRVVLRLAIEQYNRGEIEAARTSIEQVPGIVREQTETAAYFHHTYARLEPMVYVVHGAVLQLLGYPEQARKEFAEAIRLGGRRYPYVGLIANETCGRVNMEQGEVEQALARLAEMNQLGTQYGIPSARSYCRFIEGWAAVQEGQHEQGIAAICEAIDELKTRGRFRDLLYYEVILAQVYLQTERYEEGLALVEEGLASADQLIQRPAEPELLRLKGELLAANGANASAAERCFRSAIEIARMQHARLYELKAIMGLNRLWRAAGSEGQRAEARHLLAGAYAWFTEGFDTLDLKEAKKMLDE